MLKYFNVTENDANILTITSAEEYEALGNVATSAQLGTRAISCSYVEPTSEGGLDIKSNNLTWVTVGMIRNALITAGIDNKLLCNSCYLDCTIFHAEIGNTPFVVSNGTYRFAIECNLTLIKSYISK